MSEIAEELRDFEARAKENKVSQEELGGGTFTFTNLGAFTVSNFAPIVNPP